MAFNVRNNRQEDGTYLLSYGKGKRKLTAKMMKGDCGNWSIEGHADVYPTMKTAKAAWGEWAESNYSTNTQPTVEDSNSPTDSPLIRQAGHVKCGNKYEAIELHLTGQWAGKYFAGHHGPCDTLEQAARKWSNWAKASELRGCPGGEDSSTRPALPPKRKGLKTSGPPKRTTKNGYVVCDPFDPRFFYPSDAPESLRGKHTPLGALVEAWYALKTHPKACTVTVSVQFELERTIARECPDLLTEDGDVQAPYEAAASRLERRGADSLKHAGPPRTKHFAGAGRTDIPF